jgi:hypothetical protein
MTPRKPRKPKVTAAAVPPPLPELPALKPLATCGECKAQLFDGMTARDCPEYKARYAEHRRSRATVGATFPEPEPPEVNHQCPLNGRAWAQLVMGVKKP